jgi:hypothetical protein
VRDAQAILCSVPRTARRLGARPGDVTGQHQRVAQERVRKQTGAQPIVEEAAGE